MAKKVICRICGHLRKLYSKEGCVDLGCGCVVKYLERDMFIEVDE